MKSTVKAILIASLYFQGPVPLQQVGKNTDPYSYGGGGGERAGAAGAALAQLITPT